MDDTTPKESIPKRPVLADRARRAWPRRIGWGLFALLVIAALTWTLWPQAPQPQRAAAVADELAADHERLREAFRLRLLGV